MALPWSMIFPKFRTSHCYALLTPLVVFLLTDWLLYLMLHTLTAKAPCNLKLTKNFLQSLTLTPP